jgi:hypothetical protein
VSDVSIHRSPDDVPGWNEIASEAGAYAMREWLAMFDWTNASFVAVHDADAIVAVAACFHVTAPDQIPALSEPLALFPTPEDGAAYTEALYPFVFCGAPRGYHNPLIIREGLDPARRARSISRLRSAIAELGRGLRAKHAFYAYVPPADAKRLIADHPEAIALFATAEYFIPLSTWDGYLAGMGQRRRRAARLGVERLANGGLRVDRPSLRDSAAQLVELFADQQLKFHPTASRKDIHDLFEGYYQRMLEVGLEDTARIFTVSVGGEVVSGAEFISDRTRYYGRTGGSRADAPRELDVYFNCGYYDPIVRAISEGKTELIDGIAAGELKMLRGCRPRPLWSVIDPLAPFDPELVARLAAAAHARFDVDAALVRTYFDERETRLQLELDDLGELRI